MRFFQPRLQKSFIFNKFDLLPEQAQRVLVDMRFNLGYKRFRKFKNMIKAVKNQDFHSTAREMRDSLWYHQVGKRAEHLTEMMENSELKTLKLNT